MCNRTKKMFFGATVLATALALSQAASAGRVVLNSDEWAFTDDGFSVATPSTMTFATNLASYLNIDGGACKLLVYSSNFGLTGSALNGALTGAGCSVTYSTGAFDSTTLSGFDGVLLAGTQYAYNAATLTAYVNSGHGAYIAGGTGVANDAGIWDSFTQAYGLDFGPNYNGIFGNRAVSGASPLFTGVSQIYFNNGNTVGLQGSDPGAQVFNAGLLGVYDDTRQVAIVPEPASLALIGLGLAGLGFSRRRSPLGSQFA